MRPKKRVLRSETDVYLKIVDILYFYKEGESDKEKTIKRLNLLKLVVKKKFNEELAKIVDEAKDLIYKKDKEAFDEFYSKYNIENLEKSKKEKTLLEFIK